MATRERSNLSCDALRFNRPTSNAPFKPQKPKMSTSKADFQPQTGELNGNFKTIPSSDDEETVSLDSGKKKNSDNDIFRLPDSDTSEDERFKRADIKPSDLRPRKPEPATNIAKRIHTGRSSRGTSKRTVSNDPNSAANPKRSNWETEKDNEDNTVKPGAGMAEHLDFTKKSSQSLKQRKIPNIYSGGKIRQVSNFGFTKKRLREQEIGRKKVSQKSETSGSNRGSSKEWLTAPDDDGSDISLEEDVPNQGPQDTLKILEDSDNDNSPQKPQSFFKSRPPGLDSPQSASPRKRIKSGDRVSQRGKEPQDSDDDRPKLRAFPPDDLEIADTSSQNISPARPKTFKDMKPSPASVPSTLLDHIPDSIQKMAAKNGSSEILQDLDDSVSFAASPTLQYSPEPNDYPKKKSQALCPMCDEPVDIADLKAWGTMNAQRQAKFCRSHKKKAVKDSWNSRGYPKIDWENLDLRIAQHHSFIKSLINGTSSHFGDLLNEAIKSGKRRSIKDMISYTSPGYYGTRGLSTISDNINANFSSLLKQRAVEYRLISARGRSTFIQAVLVPEVACRLIMDDMNVPIEKARDIMKDSIEDGDLVNEEVKDKIVIRRHDSDKEDDTYGIR